MSTPSTFRYLEQSMETDPTHLLSQMEELVNRDPLFSNAMSSIMVDFVNIHRPNGISVLPHVQQNFSDLFRWCFQVMADQVEKSKVEEPEVFTYTTSELATFFGVTKTTINNWIDNGQFLQIERPERGKHVRIPDTTIWVSKRGVRCSVKDVVEEYEREQAELERVGNHELKTTAVMRIKHYEEKYGSYDQLLNKQERTFSEDGDLEMWNFYRNCLEGDSHDPS